MNYASKTCPHCKVPLQRNQSAFELVKRGMTSAESSQSIPVSLYFCPQCGYIELYNLQVTGRL